MIAAKAERRAHRLLRVLRPGRLHQHRAEEHYRYHQFYGGCFISLLIMFVGWIRNSWVCDTHTAWIVIGFLLLGVLLERSAFDSYKKYTSRTKAVVAGIDNREAK